MKVPHMWVVIVVTFQIKIFVGQVDKLLERLSSGGCKYNHFSLQSQNITELKHTRACEINTNWKVKQKTYLRIGVLWGICNPPERHTCIIIKKTLINTWPGQNSYLFIWFNFVNFMLIHVNQDSGIMIAWVRFSYLRKTLTCICHLTDNARSQVITRYWCLCARLW